MRASGRCHAGNCGPAYRFEQQSASVCGQSVAATVELVAEGVHLAPHFSGAVACFHVDGFVVSALAKRAAAVGVGIVVNDGVHQRTHIADSLSSGQVNRQVSAAFVAFRDHFFQLQGIRLATPYKVSNFQHQGFLMSPSEPKHKVTALTE